jgi:hypothetical protein
MTNPALVGQLLDEYADFHFWVMIFSGLVYGNSFLAITPPVWV